VGLVIATEGWLTTVDEPTVTVTSADVHEAALSHAIAVNLWTPVERFDNDVLYGLEVVDEFKTEST
jgi:hypothetical protein